MTGPDRAALEAALRNDIDPWLGCDLYTAKAVRELVADGGNPTVVAEPDGELAQRYREIARRTVARLSLTAKDFAGKFPRIVME